MKKQNKPLTKSELKVLATTSDDDLKSVFPNHMRGYLRKIKKELTPISEQIEMDKKMAEKQATISITEKKYKELLKENEKILTELNAYKSIGREIETFKILPTPSLISEATAFLIASDWHYEEEVKPGTVNGLNTFNLNIANQRIEKFFQNSLKLIEMSQQNVTIKDVVLALLGDFISGNIHDDLIATAQLDPIDASREIQTQLASGIDFLLKHTKCDITVPCCAGNHCIQENTQVLTSNGWKKAKKITNDDEVASFNLDGNIITYNKPVALTSFTNKDNYFVKSKWKNELVTSGHNLVIGGRLQKVDNYEPSNTGELTLAGNYLGSRVDISDDELKLATWVAMDGTIVLRDYKVHHIQFKISKKRKIERLKEVLEKMKIPYTITKATMSKSNVLQPYMIRIYSSYAKDIALLLDNKSFPQEWQHLNSKQLNVVLETISITDGRLRNNQIEWTSINKKNINVIQAACILNGIPCRYKVFRGPSGFESDRKLYIIFIFNGDMYKLNNKKNIVVKKITKEDIYVGIQTVDGTLITRRNGVVNFTGNSRITKQSRVSTEIGNALETFIYSNLAWHYRNEKRIKFILQEGYLVYFDVYGKTIRFHHGHNIRFAGGVGGIYIPVNRAISQWNKGKHADYDVFGHWHQSKVDGHFICNGSLIGYNAFAVRIKADYEDPQQTFFLIDRDRGRTIMAPILLTRS